MRTPFIAGNWKLHTDAADAPALARGIREALAGPLEGVRIAVCPPFPFLAAVAREVEGCAIGVGAQDCHFEEKGAFTGAVSAKMIASLGITYVIVGHSERRDIFGDSDAVVRKKIDAALAAALSPIVCVGEHLEERDAGRQVEVVLGQVEAALAERDGATLARMQLAYEPIWAIGTGRTATPAQAEEMHAHIRSWLRENAGAEAAEAMAILYGGSVKPGNAGELLAQPNVDGALVGGASLKADSFAGIVRAAL